VPPVEVALAGARLVRVAPAGALRATVLPRADRLVRHRDLGASTGAAHASAFDSAAAAVTQGGVTLVANNTHIWDGTAGGSWSTSADAAARITCVSSSGEVLLDIEGAGLQVAPPDGTRSVVVTCLGVAPSTVASGPAAMASAFAPANRPATTGWLLGTVAPQPGPATLLPRGAVVRLARSAVARRSNRATTQAAVRVGDAIVDQAGVETWLPIASEVVIVLLEQDDPSAVDANDLAIAVSGGALATPPSPVVDDRRRALIYTVASRDPDASWLRVAVASKTGWRLAGVVGARGRAAEWVARLALSPEPLVSDGALTPHGQVVVRYQPAQGGAA
jgi:hypothetical protein